VASNGDGPPEQAGLITSTKLQYDRNRSVKYNDPTGEYNGY